MIGFTLLITRAALLVHGASSLAGSLGVPPPAIGLTIVAYGTSMPELVVSVDAAVKNDAGIGRGNVVGSNILESWE